MTRVRIRRLRLGETTSTDVLKGGVGICRVFVRTLFRAALRLVEPDTNVVGLHVGRGDTVNPGGAGLLLLARAITGPTTPAATTGVLLASATGALGAFLERDRLRHVDVPTPQGLKLFFDGTPRVGPLEIAHLPRIMNFLVNLYDGLVFVVERHLYQELQKGEPVCENMVEAVRRGFRNNE